MTFPTRLQTLLDEGRIAIRSGLKFEFGTGTYCLTNNKYELVSGGNTFIPNGIIEVEEPVDTLGTASVPLKIRLPAALDFGLTPDKLRLIENEDYKGKPVTLYDFYIDPDDRSLLHTEPQFYGYVDTIDHVSGPGEYALVANVETSALDNFRDGYRTASDADQQLVSPGDKFFQYAGTTKHEYFDIKL